MKDSRAEPARVNSEEAAAIAVEPGLQQYLRQINECDLLTAQQEKDLARAIHRGTAAATQFARGDITIADKEEAERKGNEARELMIRSNLRLVVSIAKVYSNRGMPLSDLIEEGNLGLLRAVEGFDPDMGSRFSTYSSWWIKQAIKRSLINTVQPVHIPAYMVEMIGRWKKVHRILEEQLGRTPSIPEVAKKMELPEKKVRIIKLAVRAFSAPTQTESPDGSLSLSEILPDDRTKSPQEAVFSAAESDMIGKLLDALDEREGTILRLRYGLEDEEPLTLKEIGKRIGLTRERVRQLESEALRKLERILSPD